MKKIKLKDVLKYSDTDYPLFNENFREFHWFKCKYHINEKVVRALEFMLYEYNNNDLSIDDLKNMNNDYDLLLKHIKSLSYSSEYFYKDVAMTLFILIDYVSQ